MATRQFVYRQIVSAVSSLADAYLERQFGPARERSQTRWKERIDTLDLLLDAEPDVRRKITRLTTWLHQQNRHEDLKSLQQFLTALQNRSGAPGMSAVIEVINGFLGRTRPRQEGTAERLIGYLAGLIGDTGSDDDFTEAVHFLEGTRIIGFPPEQHRKNGLGSNITAQLKEASASLDKASAWFQNHTRVRHRRRPPQPLPQ